MNKSKLVKLFFISVNLLGKNVNTQHNIINSMEQHAFSNNRSSFNWDYKRKGSCSVMHSNIWSGTRRQVELILSQKSAAAGYCIVCFDWQNYVIISTNHLLSQINTIWIQTVQHKAISCEIIPGITVYSVKYDPDQRNIKKYIPYWCSIAAGLVTI